MKTRAIRSGLKAKGFEEFENDHTFLLLVVDGKRSSIRTKLSHGETDCNDPLLGMMARQLRLSRRQFEDLVNCPLSREGYLSILREKGQPLP